MTVHELSRADAPRIAVRAQLLDRSRPAGLLELVRQLTLLQIDPTAAIAPTPTWSPGAVWGRRTRRRRWPPRSATAGCSSCGA